MSSVHDVVIAGAGPGGSATAHFLARRGFDVLLLDKATFPRDKTCGDGLTPRAVAVLREMGLLGEVMGFGCRIGGMDMFAPNGGKVALPLPRESEEAMLIAPRRLLDDAIRRRAVASGATFVGEIEVTSIERDEAGVTVRAARHGEQQEHRARVAVVATGASLTLPRGLGLLPRQPLMMVAARAYFEGMQGLRDRVHCHFDSVPLPGYGWVFPTSATSANIGAGVIPFGIGRRRLPASGRQAFDSFLANPLLRQMLGPARRAGPVKGYPIRIDFDRSRTFADRVLLVGEAAGLVNPLTGEGIDYALESAQIAAECLAELLPAGDLSAARLAAYDRQLRRRFQRLFLLSNRLRAFYMNPLLLNRTIGAAGRHADIAALISSVAIGNKGLDQALSLGMLLKVAFAA